MLDSVGGIRKILLPLLFGALFVFRSRATLQLEIIALRHQLEVLQHNRPARIQLTRLDRALWVLLYRFWPPCLDAVVVVRPATVIRWHRKGFRAFWTWKSRLRRRGRPSVPADHSRRRCRILLARPSKFEPLYARAFWRLRGLRPGGHWFLALLRSDVGGDQFVESLVGHEAC